MNRFLVLICLTYGTSICNAQEAKIPVSVVAPGNRFELVGELGLKLGETATVEGTIAEGPHKGFEGGPNLIVQRINGKAIQQQIQIPVSSYFGEFGEASFDKKALPACKNGFTYRLRVYETGGFVGIPSKAYNEAGIALQTAGFYFRNSLTVMSGDQIEPIVWSPKDFADSDALLAGIAQNEDGSPVIESSGWKLLLTDADRWTDDEIGKQAEVFGTVRATKSKQVFRVENCRARLVRLKDQVGRMVRLRGMARSVNDHWWFNYRGTDMYVEGMKHLPNWTRDNHGSPVEISGLLEKAELPRIDQIIFKEKPDLATYYIVRRPKWASVEGLLTPELPVEE